MPILPSLEEQLRSAREEAGTDFIVAHIDTCLSCYLQDHHNRDGELLLGVYVDGETTIGEVLDQLSGEFASIGWDLGEDRRGFDYDKAKAALARFGEENADRLDRIFDPSLEVLSDEEKEDAMDEVQAWFLISWDVPEEDESSAA